MKDQVDILLATYQGGFYLEEQLHSIMQQTYPHFHLWIRDDSSTDQTTSIINSFFQKYPKRISIVSSAQRLGIKGNFSELMSNAKANYVMFCDQDDYWLPHKVQLSLHRIKALEKQHGIQTPLLIHTDLKVVASDLTLIDSSFWHYSQLKPSLTTINYLLVQNSVTGCTLLINQSLLRLSYPIPPQSIMHDWWIALVATLFGKIDYIEEPTILYRQHGKNDVGAQKFKFLQFIKNRLYRLESTEAVKKYIQAEEILDRYSHLLNSSQREILEAFCSLKNLPYFRRLKKKFYYHFLPHTLSK